MDKLNSPRELRGLAILSNGNAITHVHKGLYLVKSQTGIGEYEVHTHSYRQWTCTCPDFKERQSPCKHIYAVKFSKKLSEDIETDHEKHEEIMANPNSCPNCESGNIIKRGVRKTTNGEVQRYYCKDCNHRFTLDNGFSRMKHDPKAVTLSMDLYFKGISLRKICDHLKQFYNLEVSQTTPMRWIKKYMELLAQYSEKYKAEVGNVWHSDEMTVNVKGKGDRYFEWIWNIMDAKTRYLLACRVTKTKFVDDAKMPLRDAKARTDSVPDVIVTDGLQAYKTAIPNEFYDYSPNVRNPHLRLKDFETFPNNNILERLNGTVRERLKVMRGIMSPEDFANAILVYYNYLRPHQALDGHTPAEMANIPIDLDGNRWLKMIELAMLSKKSKRPATQQEGGVSA
jgi:transposase-like protein